jgi:hypothetical protein
MEVRCGGVAVVPDIAHHVTSVFPLPNNRIHFFQVCIDDVKRLVLVAIITRNLFSHRPPYGII